MVKKVKKVKKGRKGRKIKAKAKKMKVKPKSMKARAKKAKVKAKKANADPKIVRKITKIKKKLKKIQQNEVTAKQAAKKVLNNSDLYKAYATLLTTVKQASNAKEKTVKGSAITFWGNRAKAILSANSKEVRLYYAVGQKKRYRESPEQEGTVVFAHSSSLLTEGVQKEIFGYLRDIFTKYEKKGKERPDTETAISQVVDTFGEEEEKEDKDEDEEE